MKKMVKLAISNLWKGINDYRRHTHERKYLKTDFATNLNTVLKIAKKRAFVDAILTATHASKVFTQDIEDIVKLQLVKPDDRNNTSR